MGADDRTLVVRVRPGASPRRAREVVGWLRALLPAAVLLVGAGAPPAPDVDGDRVITIDADFVGSGPLALAAALARRAR